MRLRARRRNRTGGTPSGAVTSPRLVSLARLAASARLVPRIRLVPLVPLVPLVSLVSLVTAGLVVLVAPGAVAHGAPQYPVSRAVACGSEGHARSTPACRAARAGAGGDWFSQWDNVRVAGVDGRDRQVVSDGRLCSGGIAGFSGLDLARTDWPATSIRAGARITVGYRTTIPHRGTFRVYLTREGYDPRKPLRWSDLPAEPFLTATDPPVSGGAYHFSGSLPAAVTGRHVVYTVWQNSSTADTYYSCSDVVLTRPAAAPARVGPTRAEPRTAPTTRPARASTSRPTPARPSASPSAPTRSPDRPGPRAAALDTPVNGEPTSSIEQARSLSGVALVLAGLFGLLGFGVLAGVLGRHPSPRPSLRLFSRPTRRTRRH
jgi:predicted carbohydrate-binding protein with CBM5 and CBM33 domain